MQCTILNKNHYIFIIPKFLFRANPMKELFSNWDPLRWAMKAAANWVDRSDHIKVLCIICYDLINMIPIMKNKNKKERKKLWRVNWAILLIQKVVYMSVHCTTGSWLKVIHNFIIVLLVNKFHQLYAKINQY